MRFYALLAATLCALTVFVAVAATTEPNKWHAPTTHEHGDGPAPAWADAWSMANFQHPVQFGGDEQTPMELQMKPTAYKGYAFRKNGVDIYVRVHLSSNVADRGAEYHSYEIYARDATGQISFWQGWMDFGSPDTQRFHSCSATLDDTHPLHKQPHGWVSAPDLAAWNSGCRFERWYLHAQAWQWDIVIDILNPTTLYVAGETKNDPQSSWVLTPNHGTGTQRRIAVYWYGTGSTRYPDRNNPGPRGWFCSTAQGAITKLNASGPADCGSDLPQFISPSFPTVESVTAWVTRSYACPGGCAVPD